MQRSNQSILNSQKIDNLPNFLYKSRFIIVLIFSILLLLIGCSKSASNQISQNLVQQYFEQNILNHNFKVQLATDSGVDITAQYNSYTFQLLKSTSFNGPMTAFDGTTTYNGTWSCNSDYSQLVITLPSSPSVFIFLNRAWRFTKKNIPIMELAPWGTTEPIVLHMQLL